MCPSEIVPPQLIEARAGPEISHVLRCPLSLFYVTQMHSIAHLEGIFSKIFLGPRPLPDPNWNLYIYIYTCQDETYLFLCTGMLSADKIMRILLTKIFYSVSTGHKQVRHESGVSFSVNYWMCMCVYQGNIISEKPVTFWLPVNLSLCSSNGRAFQ